MKASINHGTLKPGPYLDPNRAKHMPIFQFNGFGLKARLADLMGYSFKHTISYLISFPLRWGRVGMGVDILDLPAPP